MFSVHAYETLLTGNSCIPQKWMINHETKIVLFMKVSVPSASLSVCLQGAVTYGPGMRFCCRTKPVLFECRWFVSNSSVPTQNPSWKNKLCALGCFQQCMFLLFVCWTYIVLTLYMWLNIIKHIHSITKHNDKCWLAQRNLCLKCLKCLILFKRKVLCQHFICIFN